MNAPATFDLRAVAPTFTRAELEALLAALDERIERAQAAHHWSNPSDPRAYLRQFHSLALDCLVELDGEEPETVNPQAELSDMLDVACMSVHHAMQRHMAVQAVKVAA